MPQFGHSTVDSCSGHSFKSFATAAVSGAPSSFLPPLPDSPKMLCLQRGHSTCRSGRTMAPLEIPGSADAWPDNRISASLVSNTLQSRHQEAITGVTHRSAVWPAVPPMHSSNSMASESYVPAVHANGQGMAQSPFSLVSQNRVMPAPAAPSSYGGGHPLPIAYESARPVYRQPELPQTSIYPTMPSEPLRSTR